MPRPWSARGPSLCTVAEMNTQLRLAAARLTWLSWSVLLVQQVADAWTLQAPWFIWVVKILPLLLFLPGMLKDNL